MVEWIRTLIGGSCILTILLHLLPKGKFTKYVKFYCGLIFFLIATGPVLELLAGEGELERLLRLEFLKEDYSELERAVTGMDELKSDQIKIAYQQEIHRQIEEIALAYGVQNARTEVSFDPEDGYALQSVVISFPLDAGEDPETFEQIRDEVASVYMLEKNRIRVTGGGSG